MKTKNTPLKTNLDDKQADVFRDKATVAIGRGDWETALENLKSAYSIRPNGPYIRLQLINTLVQLNRFNEVIPHLVFLNNPPGSIVKETALNNLLNRIRSILDTHLINDLNYKRLHTEAKKERAIFPSEHQETKRILEKYKREYLTISCGSYTYGAPILELAPHDSPRKLTIGRYCSIGENVRIFVGRKGIHPIDTLSTYPLAMVINKNIAPNAPKASPNFKPSKSVAKNLDVTIGNDVWIGTNATIFAGITIGHGAVIGAGTIVTRDVPDFAVVVGSPARIVKYRHDKEIIDGILNSRWWELEPNEIWLKVGEDFCSSSMTDVLKRLSSEKELSEEEMIFKFWPSEEIQQNFTGGAGKPLLQRTKNFVSFLENEGIFNLPNLHILDYGCGWGRIASAIYVLHKSKITAVDAWEKALELLQKSKLPVDCFQVPEQLNEQSLGYNNYDVAYSFSIFTHLNEEAFNNNITFILKSLKENGRFYFTVRHEDFLNAFNSDKNNPLPPINNVDDNEFLFFANCGKNYGQTIIGRNYLSNRFKNVSYYGAIETSQHLYCISKKASS